MVGLAITQQSVSDALIQRRLSAPALFVLIVVWLLSCTNRSGDSSNDLRDVSPQDQKDSDSGVYLQGAYKCCGKGHGTSCCNGAKPGLCFSYGGIYGECRGLGAQYDGKVVCAFCCDGLVAVGAEEVVPGADGGTMCQRRALSLLQCVKCGNG